jgi:hypothetical protein
VSIVANIVLAFNNINMTEIKDDGALERIKDFFAEQMERTIERDMMMAEAQRAAIEELTPTKAQAAWGAAQFAPGAASLDLSGGMVIPPPEGLKLQDLPAYMLEGEKMLSAAENWERGGWGYLEAIAQGLGSLGDATYAAGPLVGATLGSVFKAPGVARNIAKAALSARQVGKGAKTNVNVVSDIDRGIGALDTNLPVVMQPPIRVKHIYQEFGIDEVRRAEAALKRQQGDLDSVEAMVKRAEAVNPPFQANIDSVANSVGGEKAGKYIKLSDGSDFDVEVKTQKSIASKIERRPGMAPADFTDGVRTTIYLDTATQADEAVDQIGRLYTTIDRGWQRMPESGYFDRKLNILVPNKNGKMIVAEVQLKTPEIHEAGLKGHKWYERSRELEGQYQHAIPPDRLGEYHLALSEQLRLYGDAAAVTDPEIMVQLIPKL